MKHICILLPIIFISLTLSAQDYWKNIAVTENTELYVDSSSVKTTDGLIYARTKTIYTNDSTRQAYVAKIKNVFKKKDADKKIQKWEGFNYSISYGIYDCSNKRFKILEVEDYTIDNKRIVKTKVKEDKAKWILVDIDTVGDYVLFDICDNHY